MRRALLQRATVYVDNWAVEDVGAVWIETVGFERDERERIQRARKASTALKALS